ncbi:MAG TPA: glycosyltransferase [Chitinophagaceae bacterium]|nr:glycosyltransferase [Chitinophagaceae bacterium]
MEVSVVIPTCNRRKNLFALLNDIQGSSYPIKEIIIVDSSDQKLKADDLSSFTTFPIRYIDSEKSVCAQRNKGIAAATTPWVFVCDDDIEVPVDYLVKIGAHIDQHPDAVAVSGLVLQLEKNNWVATYPIRSTRQLLWNYIFQLSIWGPISCPNNFLTRGIKKYYQQKGNHISKSGWPAITNFNGDYFTTPVYGLGASVIKSEWLRKFPYPEMLDSHGIGDNYGLAINFPPEAIHVLNNACVFHHQDSQNRLERSAQYFRRVMALDFFMKTNENLKHTKKRFLIWSLLGNLFSFILKGDVAMVKVTFKTVVQIIDNKNPYFRPTSNKANTFNPQFENQLP